MGDFGDILVLVFLVAVGVISSLGKVLSDYLARKREEEIARRGRPGSPGPRLPGPPKAPVGEPGPGPTPPPPVFHPLVPAVEPPPPPEPPSKPAPVRIRRHPPRVLGELEHPIDPVREAPRERAENRAPALAAISSVLPSQVSPTTQGSPLPSPHSPAPVPSPAARKPGLTPSELRRAVILAEILGPPLALRDPFGGI
jgi:hypothetical protein